MIESQRATANRLTRLQFIQLQAQMAYILQKKICYWTLINYVAFNCAFFTKR